MRRSRSSFLSTCAAPAGRYLRFSRAGFRSAAAHSGCWGSSRAPSPPQSATPPPTGGAGLQSFVTPPGEMLVAPETLSDVDLPEGATPLASDGTLLPPLRVQAQLVPGVLVVDIGIAQRLLKMPGQISRLLVGKAKA